MEPENAIHCFDLGGSDEAGKRNSDRMQTTFERFRPNLQKALQLGEIWVEVVVLPDVALQQPGMVNFGWGDDRYRKSDLNCARVDSTRLHCKVSHRCAAGKKPVFETRSPHPRRSHLKIGDQPL
jgi:hypothetical protein